MSILRMCDTERILLSDFSIKIILTTSIYCPEVLIPGILGPEIQNILVLETWMELEPLV